MIAVLDTLCTGESVFVEKTLSGTDILDRNYVINPIFYSEQKAKTVLSFLSGGLNFHFHDQVKNFGFVECEKDTSEFFEEAQEKLPDFSPENLVLPPGQDSFFMIFLELDQGVSLQRSPEFQEMIKNLESKKESLAECLKSFEKKGGMYYTHHRSYSEERAHGKMYVTEGLRFPAMFHHDNIEDPRNPIIREVNGSFRLAYPRRFIEPIITGELGPEQGRDNPITR